MTVLAQNTVVNVFTSAAGAQAVLVVNNSNQIIVVGDNTNILNPSSGGNQWHLNPGQEYRSTLSIGTKLYAACKAATVTISVLTPAATVSMADATGGTNSATATAPQGAYNQADEANFRESVVQRLNAIALKLGL